MKSEPTVIFYDELEERYVKHMPRIRFGTDLHRVVNADCFQAMPWIPDRSVNLICVDLPYGETSSLADIKIPMDDYVVARSKNGNKHMLLTQDEYFLHCFKLGISYKESLFRWATDHQKGLWSMYNRILAPGGNIVLFAQGSFMGYLMESNREQYKYDICWNKVLVSDPLNAKNKPLRKHESMLVFNNGIVQATYNPQFTEGAPLHSKGTAYIEKELVNNNYGKFNAIEDTRKGSTQKYPTTIIPEDIYFQTETYVEFQKPHPSKAVHQTEKSVPLLEWVLKTYSNPGDIVLDNTAGSGPIIEACINTGRFGILIEKNPVEYQKIKKRTGHENNL